LAEEARRLATCLQLAESVGAVDRLSTLLIEYARHRHAFGRPIGGFQALKHRIADITLLVESCKGAADAAVDAVSNDSEDADLLISVAKSDIGDRSIRIAQECTQMFGGIGLTWEHDAHLYLRRVTSNRALLGTPEQHRRRVTEILRVRDAVGGKDVH
jgi:alkylation response protein AidB-like acyl-CoA dehydrogenase